LRPYSFLDKLQERGLYCDTEFVIYIQHESKPELIERGDNLGYMISVPKPGEYIEEFVSGGPKNYSYKVAKS